MPVYIFNDHYHNTYLYLVDNKRSKLKINRKNIRWTKRSINL